MRELFCKLLDKHIIEYFQKYFNSFCDIFRKKGGDMLEVVTVFDRISERAKEKRMSINQLEEKAELSRGSIYKWNSVSPCVKNLKKVADVLGCSVNDLIE